MKSQRSLQEGTDAPRTACRLRIAFVLPGLGMGGAEQVVRLLARHLSSRHQVLVVSTSAGGAMQSLFVGDGIRLAVVDSSRRIDRPLSWVLSFARSVLELRRVLADFAPDIVNLHLFGPELDTWLAARLAHVDNLVVTIHSVYPVFRGRRWRDRLKRLRLRTVWSRCKSAIAVSDQVREWAVEHRMVRPDRVYVVENGVDSQAVGDQDERARLRREERIPSASTTFISVASLRAEKGHPILFEAIARLPMEVRSRAVFLLVGDGSERQELERRTRSLGIAESVRFLGIRLDVPELLAMSDVFVVSSQREGLSMALLEAMSAGLPVVSTRVAGSTLVVQDHVNGILVPIGDSEALSAALAYCVENPSDLVLLGTAARKKVEQEFSARQMAVRTEAVFTRLLCGGAPSEKSAPGRFSGE